jgi:CARDB
VSSGNRRLGIVLVILVLAAVFAAGQVQVSRQKIPATFDKVSIHGHVKAPDGRGLPGITLTLTCGACQPAVNMTDSTNSAGFYSFAVSKAQIGKTFQLVPSSPAAPGAAFNPGQRNFGLTENPNALDFIYQGPLPDLTCSQANIFFEPEGQSRHYYIQVTILNRVNNGQGLACGSFKVRATYEDRTVNPWQMRQAVYPVPGLGMGLTHVEGHINIGVYPPQAYFRLVKVEVDFENAIIESDEGNNVKSSFN